jgi:hypothetical protein
VEPEHLDTDSQVGERALGDRRSAVCPKRAVEPREVGGGVVAGA